MQQNSMACKAPDAFKAFWGQVCFHVWAAVSVNCRNEGYITELKSSSASDPPHVPSLLKHFVVGNLKHMPR